MPFRVVTHLSKNSEDEISRQDMREQTGEQSNFSRDARKRFLNPLRVRCANRPVLKQVAGVDDYDYGDRDDDRVRDRVSPLIFPGAPDDDTKESCQDWSS